MSIAATLPALAAAAATFPALPPSAAQVSSTARSMWSQARAGCTLNSTPGAVLPWRR